MKINQKEDGSGEIHFTIEERKIISEKGKITLSTTFLKHFINLFISLFIEFQKNFDDETRNLTTPINKEIETGSDEDKDPVDNLLK
tara:strand:- start:63 stop:320 length:258 start_codon:yes stop_codon:yes gene_type:complete